MWLLCPWAHTRRKPVLLLSLRRQIKGQDLALFLSKTLGFVLAAEQSVCPWGEFYSLTSSVPASRRSEMRHARHFIALLVFFICSYVGKFCFKTVNTISLQALHFYEGGNEKDKCYSCSWICLLFPLSVLERAI